MLQVIDLTIEYPPHLIFDKIKFSVEKKSTLGIAGKSGCGKSTLLNAIAGTLTYKTKKLNLVTSQPIISGDIIWNDCSIKGSIGHASLMHQEHLLLPWFTIIDNMSLPLLIQGKVKSQARAIAKEFLQHFNMSHVSEYYPSQLSSGMQQRISLLRTCINAQLSSTLVLLDEPFARLDMITTLQCREWAKTILNELGATTILVTHDVEEAIEFSDKILVLKTSHPNQNSSIVFQTNIENHSDSTLKAQQTKLIKKNIFQHL